MKTQASSLAIFGFVLGGLILRAASKGFEAMGDGAPMIEGGVSTDRLMFHLFALVLLIAAAACWLRAAYLFFRKLYKSGPAKDPELERVFADQGADAREAEFDPDAALARYLARKADSEPAMPVDLPAARATFGRKAV